MFKLDIAGDPLHTEIQHRSKASENRDVALKHDMRPLRDYGVAKIRQGLTMVEEVSRVTVRAAM